MQSNRILIVDDHFLSRKVLSRYLAPFGVCDVAVNGAEAIDAYNAAVREKDPYKLVCTDVMMPDVSGQELIRHIRKKEQEVGMDPSLIIVVSVFSLKEKIEECFTDGCNGFLTKPYTRDQLMGELSKVGFSGN
ncbi:MAG: response regulator [Planctomycetes bacterium]|nr:response regulator [Planctomycetota bacterium]